MMEVQDFHNALRVLRSIDRDQLEEAGAIGKDDNNEWGEFRRNPYLWFVRVPDDKALKVWKLMKKRLK